MTDDLRMQLTLFPLVALAFQSKRWLQKGFFCFTFSADLFAVSLVLATNRLGARIPSVAYFV
jgi:hypothetical protein